MRFACCCCCCYVTSVMSDSVWPHWWQPTRFPGPWDFPGKNTGVGCHFLLQCMKVKSESEVAQSCPTLRDPMDFSLPGSSVTWGLPRATKCSVTVEPMWVITSWEQCTFSSVPTAYIWKEMDKTIKLWTSWTILKWDDCSANKKCLGTSNFRRWNPKGF